jgi:hypothetical protein
LRRTRRRAVYLNTLGRTARTRERTTSGESIVLSSAGGFESARRALCIFAGAAMAI